MNDDMDVGNCPVFVRSRFGETVSLFASEALMHCIAFAAYATPMGAFLTGSYSCIGHGVLVACLGNCGSHRRRSSWMDTSDFCSRDWANGGRGCRGGAHRADSPCPEGEGTMTSMSSMCHPSWSAPSETVGVHIISFRRCDRDSRICFGAVPVYGSFCRGNVRLVAL